MNKTLHIKLSPREQEIVDQMRDEGYPVAEVMRELIRSYGRGEFQKEKGYSEAAKIRAQLAKKKVDTDSVIADMSNEDYATNILRGKVVGKKVEFRVANAQPVKFNLETIKQLSIENNEVVRIHNQLLDRTFTYIGDIAPTEEQYQEIWKGW